MWNNIHFFSDRSPISEALVVRYSGIATMLWPKCAPIKLYLLKQNSKCSLIHEIYLWVAFIILQQGEMSGIKHNKYEIYNNINLIKYSIELNWLFS
jgi:hypothetical protein